MPVLVCHHPQQIMLLHRCLVLFDIFTFINLSGETFPTVSFFISMQWRKQQGNGPLGLVWRKKVFLLLYGKLARQIICYLFTDIHPETKDCSFSQKKIFCCCLFLQNFEKITCHVQSKNKDQVHEKNMLTLNHYYYW